MEGQLGQGNTTAPDWDNVGDSPGDMERLNEIDLGTGRRVTDVAVTDYNTCFIFTEAVKKLIARFQRICLEVTSSFKILCCKMRFITRGSLSCSVI